MYSEAPSLAKLFGCGDLHGVVVAGELEPAVHRLLVAGVYIQRQLPHGLVLSPKIVKFILLIDEQQRFGSGSPGSACFCLNPDPHKK